MDCTVNRSRLISTLAYALRHDPLHFGLELDDEGWADLEDLIIAVRFEHFDWAFLDEVYVKMLIDGMDRFEVRGGKIRAVYGHSIKVAKPPAVAEPPTILFHGTATANVPNIVQNGILRMKRQFAHFSTDYEWVVQFLSDKPEWTIFAIHTPPALQAGVIFRKANHHVWLAECMDPRFILIHSQGHGSPVLL